MTRVEWTRTEPGDIEQVVSMLLCRENPSAVRVRPSRGDGGIDVLAPARNGLGVAVYQVKSFSSNLTAGQKAQVERSFRRVLDYAKGRGKHRAGPSKQAMFSHPYLSGQLASDRHREVLASAEQHRLAASSAPRSGHRGRPAGPPSACAGRCIATARRTEISA